MLNGVKPNDNYNHFQAFGFCFYIQICSDRKLMTITQIAFSKLHIRLNSLCSVYQDLKDSISSTYEWFMI